MVCHRTRYRWRYNNVWVPVSKIYVLQREQTIPCAVPEVFEFFADVRNLESITPPWLELPNRHANSD